MIDFILHLDTHLVELVNNYGFFTHFILFAIVFCETGLVFTPFLPGDSLLFASGALASTGALNILSLWVLLTVAAIIGDTVNYSIGSFFGKKLFKEHNRILKMEYLLRTQEFYHQHGKKAVVLARFVPIIRTFAPFVAGMGKMDYKTFLAYNVLGGITWVTLFLFAGYFFGSLPWIEHNFTLFIFVLIFVSFLPIFLEGIKHRLKSRGKKLS